MRGVVEPAVRKPSDILDRLRHGFESVVSVHLLAKLAEAEIN